MRSLLLLGLVAFWVAGAAFAQGRAPKPACLALESADAIAAIAERGEIRLASGRLAKLSGLRLPDEAGREEAAMAWLARHRGLPVTVTATNPEDRWGRVPVRLRLAGEAPLDLAHGLVEEGLAMVEAVEASVLCEPELLAIEATAREQGVGLWADERYKPARAEDRERLATRIGRFTLVEGQVRSVGERPQRTYLNFGPDGTKDLTITIPKRTWTSMAEKGLSAAALRNRRIRVRGILERGRGPTIEVTAAGMIEVLDQGRAPR